MTVYPLSKQVSADAPQAIADSDADGILVLESVDREQVLVDPLVFCQACKRLKFRPSADLFVSATHNQLHRDYSHTPDPKALGTNALSLDWQAESAPYANPSWSLIPQVLYKKNCLRRSLSDVGSA